MIISYGPIIFGLILGLIIGSQIKLKFADNQFTLASVIIIIIAGIIFAWQSGNFPFYKGPDISTGFLSALIGVLLGSLIFARGD